MNDQPDFRALCLDLFLLAQDLVDPEQHSLGTMVRYRAIMNRAYTNLAATLPEESD